MPRNRTLDLSYRCLQAQLDALSINEDWECRLYVFDQIRDVHSTCSVKLCDGCIQYDARRIPQFSLGRRHIL